MGKRLSEIVFIWWLITVLLILFSRQDFILDEYTKRFGGTTQLEVVKERELSQHRVKVAGRFTKPFDLPWASHMESTRKAIPSHMESIREAIPSRMDVASADLTEKVDYAAITSGGLIIKSGKYATTGSSWNRLLHKMKLKIYRGPEEAITPTSKDLGMCWTAVASPSVVAKVAVFSVSLRNPIYATQVAIGYPPSDVNDRTDATIRSFRVVGFERADATGKAWEMGQFEYLLGNDFLQVFDLEKKVGNAEIPVIKSLSLLIDSNWGLAYSCLYRVRVHGHKVVEY